MSSRRYLVLMFAQSDSIELKRQEYVGWKSATKHTSMIRRVSPLCEFKLSRTMCGRSVSPARSRCLRALKNCCNSAEFDDYAM
jgi:hypothetical protein